jgi:two-component system OmpR family sensor kinase
MKNPVQTWSLRSRLVLGIIILTSLGFIASGFASQALLRSYLTTQIDKQLNQIASGVLPRIQESGIAEELLEENEESDQDILRGQGRGGGPGNPNRTPLQRIPTSTSITLLDVSGNIVGGLGGDFNAEPIADYVDGFLPSDVTSHKNLPFTIYSAETDFRVLALALPDGSGTVVAGQSLQDLKATSNQLKSLYFLIGLVLLFIIGIGSRAVIRVSMRPLEDVEKTAEEIASGNLSARMPVTDPSTEVGRLVSSLNSMLARIEESFAVRTESENKLRRFVADASHELRTPITAIRGFSELHRQGAVKGEADTSALIARIENESKRMGSLVEDLLLLARLDQAREMDSKPVDISEVVTEACASARAAGPEHPVTLVTPDDVFTLGDEVRIHQVIANLLANARAHTPAGTPINVTVSNDKDGVCISVADQGPGLNAEDQKRIFERFYRADSSRVRSSGEGSGLGLSIVDAVMRAHGGSVTVQSDIGKGSVFTLHFPMN